VFGLGVLVSLPFCYISIKSQFFAALMTALPAGTALAMVLQVSVIYIVNSEYAVFIVIGILCLISLALCLSFGDHAFNVANAITSSYVIMRSIGLILDYPWEFAIYYERNVYKTQEFVRIPKTNCFIV
jgi:hypothetical protein